jgi:UMF1 family MFS transporter
MQSSKPRRILATGSWALYDFSDTIFSASILTFYFPLWVTEDKGGTDTHLGIALSASMLIVAISGPFLGTLSDRINRRVPLLGISVVSCAVFTALIGTFGGLTTGLLFFIAANLFYQTGLIFYNSLIVNVSSETGRGIVSGIGVGAGYIGLITAFLIMRPIVEEQGNQAAFLPTAALFIVFALPLLIIVRDPGTRGRLDNSLLRTSYKQLYETFRRARQHRNLFQFLIARFAYMEAINTVTAFYVLYLINVGGFEDTEAQTMIMVVVVLAIIASWATGYLVSKIGPKRVLVIGIMSWLVLAVVAVLADSKWMFWGIAIIMGCFWAVPHISDRVLLTYLSPDGQIGEFFGLFQMSGRLSAVIGPALWGATIWALSETGELRYRVALATLAFFLLAGLLLLRSVRVTREESDLDAIEARATPPPIAS